MSANRCSNRCGQWSRGSFPTRRRSVSPPSATTRRYSGAYTRPCSSPTSGFSNPSNDPMKFAPEYVSCVLNENFEDAKAQFLSPLMAIHYAHLVMLADQRIVPGAEARTIRDALGEISVDEVKDV